MPLCQNMSLCPQYILLLKYVLWSKYVPICPKTWRKAGSIGRLCMRVLTYFYSIEFCYKHWYKCNHESRLPYMTPSLVLIYYCAFQLFGKSFCFLTQCKVKLLKLSKSIYHLEPLNICHYFLLLQQSTSHWSPFVLTLRNVSLLKW